jgi:hypothetical protein
MSCIQSFSRDRPLQRGLGYPSARRHRRRRAREAERAQPERQEVQPEAATSDTAATPPAPPPWRSWAEGLAARVRRHHTTVLYKPSLQVLLLSSCVAGLTAGSLRAIRSRVAVAPGLSGERRRRRCSTTAPGPLSALRLAASVDLGETALLRSWRCSGVRSDVEVGALGPGDSDGYDRCGGDTRCDNLVANIARRYPQQCGQGPVEGCPAGPCHLSVSCKRWLGMCAWR